MCIYIYIYIYMYIYVYIYIYACMERGRKCGNVGVCLTAGVFERGRMEGKSVGRVGASCLFEAEIVRMLRCEGVRV